MNTTATDFAAPFDSADLQSLTDTVRRFATEQVRPHVDAWDAAGEFPRALYRQAAELGLLGLGYPEHLGGTPVPWRARNALSQTLARYGTSGGVMASLFSLNIGLPPVLAHGSPELQAEVIPPALRGERIAALGITEPGGGSDVASLRCTARLDGGNYVIDGEKVFITSGMRADWITLAVRTDLNSKGASGVSMIVVPGSSAGLTRSPLQKMGWHCSDTAHLRFDGVRVPSRYLLAHEGAGFRIIMGNFNGERLAMSAMALGFAQACFDEALDWARQRQTFGAPLIERQVIRHKLMDMQMRIGSTQAWVEALTARLDAGDQSPDWVANVCLLKNHATQTMQFCADAAVQILGGMGYMRGTVSERIYREVKVMMIGGGAEEIMKELAARQLGL
jgi:acyl-CoA dehydrogenase